MSSSNEIDEIKEITRKYGDITQEIDGINKQVKILRDKKKLIEDQIMDFMEKNNLNTIDISSERFMIKENVKAKSFSKKTLVEDLLSFMNQHEVDSITKRLFSEGDNIVTKTIKHKKI